MPEFGTHNHEVQRSDNIESPQNGSAELITDAAYSKAASGYYKTRSAIYEGGLDELQTQDEFFLREQAKILEKLANPKLQKEKVTAKDASLALADMSFAMAVNNPDAQQNEGLGNEDTEKTYLQSKKLFIATARKVFPEFKVDEKNTAFVTRNAIESLSKQGIVVSGEVLSVDIGLLEASNLYEQNPKKYAEELDAILFYAGDQLKARATTAFETEDADEREELQAKLTVSVQAVYRLQMIRDSLQQKIYGRGDTTPGDAKQVDSIRELVGNAEEPENKAVVSEELKTARQDVGEAVAYLQQGLSRALNIQELRLESDLPRWQELGKGLSEIAKTYRKDKRLRSEKNPEFQVQINELFEKVSKH